MLSSDDTAIYNAFVDGSCSCSAIADNMATVEDTLKIPLNQDPHWEPILQIQCKQRSVCRQDYWLTGCNEKSYMCLLIDHQYIVDTIAQAEQGSCKYLYSYRNV